MQPGMIAYGDTATVSIDLHAHESWRQIARGLVKHCGAKSLKKIRLEIYPTVGSTVKVVPSQDVLDILAPFFDDVRKPLKSAACST